MRKKLGVILYIFCATTIILCKESYCYLDPSAMTYLIQIYAAVAITIGSAFGIALYKIKRFFRNKRKKEKENEQKR